MICKREDLYGIYMENRPDIRESAVMWCKKFDIPFYWDTINNITGEYAYDIPESYPFLAIEKSVGGEYLLYVLTYGHINWDKIPDNNKVGIDYFNGTYGIATNTEEYLDVHENIKKVGFFQMYAHDDVYFERPCKIYIRDDGKINYKGVNSMYQFTLPDWWRLLNISKEQYYSEEFVIWDKLC